MPEKQINNLSGSILSRFALIWVRTQNKEEKEEIINSKSSSFSGITEKYINNIISMLQLGYPNEIKKINLLLIIFSKMNQNNGNSKSDNTENNYDYIVSYNKINEYSSEFYPTYENGKNIMHYETIIYILMLLN